MNKTYDRNHAEKLVPLLEVIVNEILERTRAVRKLAQESKPQPEGSAPSADELDRRAEIASHRREIRLSIKELERLGCVVDEQDLTRVYIPGPGGKIDRGFSWQSGEKNVRNVTSDTASETSPG